jgi:hypothetical protein
MSDFELKVVDSITEEINATEDEYEKLLKQKDNVEELTDAEVVALWYLFVNQFPESVFREGIDYAELTSEVKERDNIAIDSENNKLLRNTEGELIAPTVPK